MRHGVDLADKLAASDLRKQSMRPWHRHRQCCDNDWSCTLRKMSITLHLHLFFSLYLYSSVQHGHYWWADKFSPPPHTHTHTHKIHSASPGPGAALMDYSWKHTGPGRRYGSRSWVSVRIRGQNKFPYAWQDEARSRKSSFLSSQSSQLTFTTGKSNTNCMLNKPVCWIIEELGPGSGSD